MAEFGTVVSAIQLSETALRLRKLYAEIRNAPTALLKLVDEVAVLADVFTEICDLQTANQQLVTGRRSWEKCSQLFKVSLDELNNLVTDLNDSMKAHKRTGAVRIYLKKEELSSCKQRLESLKSTMLLAQQVYTAASVLQDQSRVRAEIQSVAAIIQHQLANSPAQHRHLATYHDQPTDNERSSTPVPWQGCGDQRVILHGTQRSSLTLKLPSWLLSKGLQILLRKDYGQFGIFFRTYNVIPLESEIIIAIRRGDLPKMQSMFNTRRASPFDITNDGMTLLHHAAWLSSANICEFLLKLGVDVCAEDESKATPINTLLLSGKQISWDSRPFEVTLQILATHHPDPFSIIDPQRPFLGSMNIRPKAFSILKSIGCPSYDKQPPHVRARLAISIGVFKPKLLSAMLGPDLSLLEAMNLTRDDQNGWHIPSILKECCLNIGRCYSCTDKSGMEYLNYWKTVLKTIIEFDRCHPICCQFSSLISYFVGAYVATYGDLQKVICSTQDDTFTVALRLWVTLLASMGADLRRYGQAERFALANQHSRIEFPIHRRSRWRAVRRAHTFEIGHLVYGPQVTDWDVFVNPIIFYFEHDSYYISRVYEIAGDFWNLVEHPELFDIPGAYFEENTPDEYHPSDGIWIRGLFSQVDGV